MATRIALTRGVFALVDDEDVELVGQYKWSASRCHGTKYIAVRCIRRSDGRKTTVSMHRLILGLEMGNPLQADHINHDTLDNRRSNLRVRTADENKRWQPSRGGSSKFVGVTWDGRGCWRAQIQVAGVGKNLGRYPTELEAAAARDAYVLEHRTGHELNFRVAA